VPIVVLALFVGLAWGRGLFGSRGGGGSGASQLLDGGDGAASARDWRGAVGPSSAAARGAALVGVGPQRAS